jgi:hypothetical protein
MFFKGNLRYIKRLDMFFVDGILHDEQRFKTNINATIIPEKLGIARLEVRQPF